MARPVDAYDKRHDGAAPWRRSATAGFPLTETFDLDWFEKLTGFAETDYASTRAKLKVGSGKLTSLVNGMSYSTGVLELASLSDLRNQVRSAEAISGRMQVSLVSGDVRDMHWQRAFAGALFQVASQFNLLEMIGPNRTPEDGVTIYQHDGTQGPACAMAAGAATIYRNYFAEVRGRPGQTADRQLDALADLGATLRKRLAPDVGELWSMMNGYALAHRSGLDAITRLLESSSADEIDELRGHLRIGLHWDVEVTDAGPPFAIVSQAFCSALPVAYSRHDPRSWERFARLVLEAAYEATLWAAVRNAQRGGSRIVLLTSLGGGAFGNDESWIEAGLVRALELASGSGLDVRLVSHAEPSPAFLRIKRMFS
jgi:hypothetical protein